MTTNSGLYIIPTQLRLFLISASKQLEIQSDEPVTNVESALPKPGISKDEAGNREPLVSSLPIEFAEFREIVCEFVDQANEKSKLLSQCIEQNDLDGIATHAHWFKGSGGTCGFDDFVVPAESMENAAKSGDFPAIVELNREIQTLISLIQLPSEIGN